MADTPSVFISYSHKDEKWKDKLAIQLGVLAGESRLEVWDDRRIAAGDDWFPEIELAIEAADVAVLLDLGRVPSLQVHPRQGDSPLVAAQG